MPRRKTPNPAPDESVGIDASNSSGAQIHGTTVVGFGTGIKAHNVRNFHANDVTVIGSRGNGMEIGGSPPPPPQQDQDPSPTKRGRVWGVGDQSWKDRQRRKQEREGRGEG